MKKLLIFIIHFLLLIIHSNAQEFKRGNTWTLGFSPVSIMDFSNTSIIFDSLNFPAISSGTSCISDTNGSLLFFTSGFAMLTRKGFVMQNGLDVNCPYGQVLSNYYSHRSIFPQTSIILPKKGNTYYVFSTGMSDSVANNYINHINTEFDVLSYCVVDMDSNAGMGKVVLKDKVLADKQHYHNTALHAVKHSNGKDWWLVKADCNNGRFQEYLVKEDTILGPFYHNIVDTGDFCYWFGTIRFNNSGTQLASGVVGKIIGGIYNRNGVGLYDFNKCDGRIMFNRFYEVPMDTATYSNWDVKDDICFSPNDSLLYTANMYSIYQIDVTDSNINNALFIHGPDTNINYFPWYDQMGLAPNGKIYIGNFSGRKYMSYIDKPNVKGLGCDFMPQGLSQPYSNNVESPPNMPNYGLGSDSTITPCWPLQTPPNLTKGDELVVYPNPTSHKFQIKCKNPKSKKELFNSVGQLVLTMQENEINVSALSKGMYYIKCDNQVKKVFIE